MSSRVWACQGALRLLCHVSSYHVTRAHKYEWLYLLHFTPGISHLIRVCFEVFLSLSFGSPLLLVQVWVFFGFSGLLELLASEALDFPSPEIRFRRLSMLRPSRVQPWKRRPHGCGWVASGRYHFLSRSYPIRLYYAVFLGLSVSEFGVVGPGSTGFPLSENPLPTPLDASPLFPTLEAEASRGCGWVASRQILGFSGFKPKPYSARSYITVSPTTGHSRFPQS